MLKRNKEGLTKKQVLLCHAYVASKFNATKAAKECGHTGRNGAAWVQKQINRCPAVKKKIDVLTAEYLSKIDLRAVDVIKEICLLGFRRMGDYIDIDPVTRRIQVKTSEEIGEKDAAINKLRVKQQCALSNEEVEPGKEYTVINSDIDITLCDKVEPLKMLANHLNLINCEKEEDREEEEKIEEISLKNLSEDEIRILIRLQDKAKGG